MDNAQIVTEVRNRVGTTSLSDQTITSLITPLIPKEGEPTEEFYTNTVNWLKTLGGNFSHDVAAQVNLQSDTKANEKFEAMKAAWKPGTVEEFYKALGVDAPTDGPKSMAELTALMSGKKPEPPHTKPEGLTAEDVKKLIEADRANNPVIAELNKKLTDMIAENDRLKNQGIFDDIVKTVSGKADELNVSDTALWEHAVEVVKGGIDRKDLTADKMLNAVKSKFEELTKLLRPAGTKPYGNTQPGGGDGGYLEKILKQRADNEKLKAEARAAQAKLWK